MINIKTTSQFDRATVGKNIAAFIGKKELLETLQSLVSDGIYPNATELCNRLGFKSHSKRKLLGVVRETVCFREVQSLFELLDITDFEDGASE